MEAFQFEDADSLTDEAADTEEQTTYNYKTLVTIEGNSDNRVQTVSYSLDDETILGYGVLSQVSEAEDEINSLSVSSGMLRATSSSFDVNDYVDYDAKNLWQIVSGLYSDNTAEYKTESEDGYVRYQKNVIPTDEENVFYVYLSVGIKQDAILSSILYGSGLLVTSANNISIGDYLKTNEVNKANTVWNDTSGAANIENSFIKLALEEEGQRTNKYTIAFNYNGETYVVTRWATNNSFNNGHMFDDH